MNVKEVCVMKVLDLTGKYALVTGATGELGRAGWRNAAQMLLFATIPKKKRQSGCAEN